MSDSVTSSVQNTSDKSSRSRSLTVTNPPKLSYTNSAQYSYTRSPHQRQKQTAKSSFIIVGYNGGQIAENLLLRKGWQKVFDKNSDEYHLKWSETLYQINFYRLRPTQLVNHIPNCGILTNKLGMLLSLRGYERYMKHLDVKNPLSMHDFIPTTFIVDDLNERAEFYKTFKENDIWISKPIGANQGKGITLIRDLEKFKNDINHIDKKRTVWNIQPRVVQRYIKNPLLIHSRKFDIRCFMLIASTIPYLVLFAPGYIRLSMNPYSNTDENLITHLTNQFVQKRSPRYHQVKEETVMSMLQFNTYFNENCKNLSNFKYNWVDNELESKLKAIMLHVFKSIKQRLANNTSYFELYGLDFMVDDTLKVWLIEANSNPSMSTQCQVLRKVIPGIVEETILLALECFDKNTKMNQPLLPLSSIRRFHVLYCENYDMGRARRFAPTKYKKFSAPHYLSSQSSVKDKSLKRSKDSSDSSLSVSNTRLNAHFSSPINKPLSDHWVHKYRKPTLSLTERLVTETSQSVPVPPATQTAASTPVSPASSSSSIPPPVQLINDPNKTNPKLLVGGVGFSSNSSIGSFSKTTTNTVIYKRPYFSTAKYSRANSYPRLYSDRPTYGDVRLSMSSGTVALSNSSHNDIPTMIQSKLRDILTKNA